MKKNILLLLLFSGTFSGIRSQQVMGKIVYQLDGIVNIQSTITMWFTKNNYIYQFGKTDPKELAMIKDKKYENLKDSLANAEKMENIKKDISNAPPQTWYGEMADDIIISSWFNLNTHKTYCIKDTMTFMAWELVDDTMTVRGIHCQKATGKYNGMNYIAWFAPSIPVPVAHMQYRGLPGLLIQCTNTTRNTSFGMTELEWPVKKEIVIQPCAGPLFFSKQQLAEFTEKQNAKQMLIKNTIEKNKQEGKTMKVTDVLKDN